MWYKEVRADLLALLLSFSSQQDSGHEAEGNEDNEDNDPLIPRQDINLHSFGLGRGGIDGLLLIN